MNNYGYMFLFILSIAVASYSQILLKLGAGKKQIYLNGYTIIGYILMVLSTLMTLLAYQKISLSLGQVLQALSFVFVSILSYIFLKEKIEKRTIIGIVIILLGILIFNV